MDWKDDIDTMRDIELGMVSFTLNEYLLLPNKFTIAMRQYKQHRQESK